MAALTVFTQCPFCERSAYHMNPWEVSYTASGIRVLSKRGLAVTGNPEKREISKDLGGS